MSQMGKISFFNSYDMLFVSINYFSVKGRSESIKNILMDWEGKFSYYHIQPLQFIRAVKHTHRGWGRKPTSVSTLQRG